MDLVLVIAGNNGSPSLGKGLAKKQWIIKGYSY